MAPAVFPRWLLAALLLGPAWALASAPDVIGSSLPAVTHADSLPEQLKSVVEESVKRFPDAPQTPVWWEQKVAAKDGNEGDQFGWAVAMQGDTAMFGAFGKEIDGGDYGRGAVYVYRRSNGVWAFTQRLVASDGMMGDTFGNAIALDNGTAVIAAHSRITDGDHGSGAVYVFSEKDGIWTETQQLTGSDSTMTRKFGVAVALDGDTMAITSHTLRKVYIYMRAGGVWQAADVVTAEETMTQGQFGLSVDLDGDRLVVGAPTLVEAGNTQHGAAFVFHRSGGVWTQVEKLLPSDVRSTGAVYYGQSVAIDGHTVLVGARLSQVTGATNVGAAYAYDWNGSSWLQTQKIDVQRPGGQFGNWVALEGNRAVISAPYATVGQNGWQGRVYVFDRGEDGVWSLSRELVASDGLPEAQYGWMVALEGSTVAVGAVRDMTYGIPYHGAGYFYEDTEAFTVHAGVMAGGGSISPAGEQAVMAGTTATFTLSPDTGYVIAAVGGTCGGTLSGDSFTTDPIQADCTVEADFAPLELTVTASVVEGLGSITPAGSQDVPYGSTLSFTLEPYAGHVIDEVTGDCGGLLDGSTYLTDPIVSDCSVEARFAPDSDRIFADGFELAD